jgi:hypothetical protein
LNLDGGIDVVGHGVLHLQDCGLCDIQATYTFVPEPATAILMMIALAFIVTLFHRHTLRRPRFPH